MTRMSRLLLITAAAATLSACASTTQVGQVEDPITPTEQWRAELASRPEEIQLAVHAGGVSPNQAEALAAFVENWRTAEAGTITIQAPSEGPAGAGAYRASESARSFLIGQGVPAEQVRVVGYRADAAAGPAPLKIGYLRHTVTLPECGREWTNIAHSMMNKPQANFGCAVTANMAAQIANPADLAGPRVMTPADVGRREVILEKYRKGEVSSAASDDQAKGGFSQVGK